MAKVRQALKEVFFDDCSSTRVTTMGHITEITIMQKQCAGAPTRKIDKDHFCDVRTGEVFEYNHIDNRSESTDSIRRTLAHIRALINTNVVEPDRVRWVTFTYAENMRDPKKLYSDYEKFWKRFCYWCKKQGYERPEYITVQEPQGRGAWHIHAFFIWPTVAPFIPNDADTLKLMKFVPPGTQTMADMWGHGNTKTTACNNCDNVGAYFSAYLADMPLDEVREFSISKQADALAGGKIEEKTFTDEQGNVKTKKFVKGGRLFLYPAGMNIVRKTKGIQLPIVEDMTVIEARKKVRSAKQTFSRTYEIVSDDGVVVNTISKIYYNSKRK